MSRRRPMRVLGLLLVVALLGSAVIATAADAKGLSKSQKAAISKQLLRTIKKHPSVISKRWFLKKATLVNFTLPATIRLNPKVCTTGSPPIGGCTNVSVPGQEAKAYLDLGPSLGARTIGLDGELKANINFNDAFDGGNLGEVRISIPAQDPINGITGAPTALTTTSVPLLTSAGLTNPASSECAAASSTGFQTNWTSLGTSYPGLDFTTASSVPAGKDALSNLSNSVMPDYANQSNLGPGPYSPDATAVKEDTVLRTGSLAVGVAPPSVDTGNGANSPLGTSGGVANLFGYSVDGAGGHNVNVGVTLTTYINSILRSIDMQTPGGPHPLNCRQAWTGYIQNNLAANLVGSLRISPAVVSDGRLRIAKVHLFSPGSGTKVKVAACLVPFAPFTGAPNPYELSPTPGDENSVNPPPSPAAGIVAAYTVPGGGTNKCNSAGPLNFQFGMQQLDGGTAYGSFADVPDSTGAAVKVSGDLKVTNLDADVLIG